MSALTQIPRLESRNRPKESLWDAVGDVVTAGQQVVLDRLDLLRYEVTADIQQYGIGAAFLAGASVLALLGWTALSVALALLLSRALPPDASVALVGALNLGIGVISFVLGLRRVSLPAVGHTDTVEDGNG
jgi:hypothetical protein